MLDVLLLRLTSPTWGDDLVQNAKFEGIAFSRPIVRLVVRIGQRVHGTKHVKGLSEYGTLTP